MNILMFTNTFVPHVGGVRRSIDTLSSGLRKCGHKVLTVAPSFEGFETDTDDVIRIPALQQVYGTGYSWPLPFSKWLGERIEAFNPDLIHSHHPFLLGATALRSAAKYDLPIVYTYHTRYEFYTSEVLGDSSVLRRALRNLCTGYCNLCDAVIAPSQSIARILKADKVTVPIRVIPTGIDLAAFQKGSGSRFRHEAGLGPSTFLVGHVGRLSEEKNLPFLAEALSEFLAQRREARAVIGGGGAQEAAIKKRFVETGVAEQVRMLGVVTGQSLADLYAAMDVFAFASLSETQGLVLQEAMAAGCPVVALDAPGAREVVHDGRTGRLLLAVSTPTQFADALQDIANLPPEAVNRMRAACRVASTDFGADHMITDVIGLYEDVIDGFSRHVPANDDEWSRAVRGLAEEQRIVSNIFHALGDAVTAEEDIHVQV